VVVCGPFEELVISLIISSHDGNAVTITAAPNGVTRTAALTVNPASQGSAMLTVTATGAKR
jgi:hypothetical protein